MNATTGQNWDFRSAIAPDSSDIVLLMDIASRGFIVEYWQTLCHSHLSPTELGRQRILERQELPSFIDNWEIASVDGRTVGAWAGYRIPKPFVADDLDELPPQYLQLLELEAIAEGSWHLAALAVFPEFRNRGLGVDMISRAQTKALESGCQTVSIIADTANSAACRLYDRLGYAIRATRPVVPFGAKVGRGEWCLFQREADSPGLR